MAEGYRVPSRDCRVEFYEKKSRFIASLRRVESFQQALALQAELRRAMPDATHHCLACRLKEPFCERFDDDGEPGGTAGMPMLEVLRKQALYQAAVVVTRYFGGILLGAGGLVRAYSKAAQDAAAEAGAALYEPTVRLRLTVPYALYDRLLRLLESFGCVTEHTEFAQEIQLTLLLRAREEEAFCRAVADATAGAVTILREARLFASFKIMDENCS